MDYRDIASLLNRVAKTLRNDVYRDNTPSQSAIEHVELIVFKLEQQLQGEQQHATNPSLQPAVKDRNVDANDLWRAQAATTPPGSDQSVPVASSSTC
jgi:hypothetical protein